MEKRSTAAKAPGAKKLKHRTWEHPTGSGIKIAEMPNKTGGKVFGVSYQVRIPAEMVGVAGRRELHQRKTKQEAEGLAEERLLALKQYGTAFSQIPAAAQKQAAIAWGHLDEHNKANGDTLNLIDAVKAGIRMLSPQGGRKTVAQVIEELSASKQGRKEAGAMDSSSVHDFTVRSGKIAGAFGDRFVSDILHTEISVWLRGLLKNGARWGGALSLRSVKNYRTIFVEIFRHAKARQYCAENPFDRFTREDVKALGGRGKDQDHSGARILTVSQSRMLLEAAQESTEPGMLGSLVLRLFCGVRTTEVCRLDWTEIHWLDPEPFVHIPASKAKKRRIRHIRIPENALAWLRIVNPPAHGPIVRQTGDTRKDVDGYCERFTRLAVTAGIANWENNFARHSFASYHYALHGDSILTAGQMGHRQSDEMLFAHYRTLTTKKMAEEYFALRPTEAGSKIEQFPKAAQA